MAERFGGTSYSFDSNPSHFQGREIIRMTRDSHDPFPVNQARNQLDGFLAEQIRGLISPGLTPLMRPEYIEQRINYVMMQIQKNLAPGYTNVSYINYIDTGFRFYDVNKKEIYRVDISKLWNESQLSPSKLAEVQAKAREQEERLKQTMERESLLGGSMIIEWTVAGTYLGLSGDAYARGGIKTLSFLDRGAAIIGDLAQSQIDGRLNHAPIRTIKHIWVMNTSGKLEKVYLGDRLAEFSARGPEWVRSNTIKILQSIGVYFDPVQKTCTNIGARAVEATLNLLKKMTLVEYRTKYGINVSEVEWEKMKASLQGATNFLARSGNSAIEMMSWVVGSGLEVVMFPVFFSQFQKQPNSSTLMAGFAEWALFSMGAKAGGAIGSKFGMLGRFFGPLAGGITGIGIGHELYEKYDGKKTKWKSFNGKDMFSSETFAVLHLATGWGVNEYFDFLNDIGPELSEKIGTKGGFDIGVPRVDWAKHIQSLIPQKELAELLTKYGIVGFLTGGGSKSLIFMGEGGGGITPDIDFYKRKVAFNMNPWEWFNTSLKGRTIDKWNTQVDAYAENLRIDTAKLLGSYFGKQSPFDLEKDPEKLKSMLQMRMGIMFMPVGDGMFNPYAIKLISGILAEVDNWNKDRSSKNISEMITQYTSFMKMDETFVRMNQLQINAEVNRMENGELSGQLAHDFDIFADQLKNQKQKQYIKNICKRVIFGDKNLFDPDEIDSNPFSERVRRIRSNEHKMFDEILNNTDEISIDSVNQETQFSSKDKIQVGRMFVSLLERLTRHCWNREFQNRIAQIDPKTQRVNFVDTSRTEGNFTELNALRKTGVVDFFFGKDKSVMDK